METCRKGQELANEVECECYGVSKCELGKEKMVCGRVARW